MTIREQAARMKLESPQMAATDLETRNRALSGISEALLAHQEEILEANRKDMKQAACDGLSQQLIKRLRFDEHKMEDVRKGIDDLIAMEDPLSRVQLKRELDSDLLLVRESCPIGVIGVIFEARPDAMVQIASLCIKSGNCAILKGGSEALVTNRTLFQVIYEAAVQAGLPAYCLLQMEARSETQELFACHESVDLLIPRGSNSFVRYIMDHSSIPVMGHADGVCHVYVDKDADQEMAVRVVLDSKTQYTAVCNAAETLLVHQDIAAEFLPKLQKAFDRKEVEIRGTDHVRQIIDCEEATEEDYGREYLDLTMFVRNVRDIDEAIEHINRYGSHHTDCIISEEEEAQARFMTLVDSAGVYVNCSTRFADGYRYGFGAEVGISTGKLHARGPVGLEGLCTYKYKLIGHGNIVADYAEGRKSFHFRDVQE